MVYLVKVWEHDTMIFEGYTKKIPKAGQDFKAFKTTTDMNGAVKSHSFSPAQYRITYENTKI